MAKITHYDVGDVWVAQATFTVSGTPTDPTTLTVTQQAADGTETVLVAAVNPATLTGSSTPVAKTSTGVFKLNPGISLTAPGYWFVKFAGTGAAAATEQQQAVVDPDEFGTDTGLDARALVDIPTVKDWLNHQNIEQVDDWEIVRAINDISDLFYEETGGREIKVMGTNPQTRTFDVYDYCNSIEIGDLATTPTTVQIIGYDWTTVLSTVAGTDYTLYPKVRETWEPIRRIQFKYTVMPLRPGFRVSVAGTWGFPAVPGKVRQAVLDAVAEVLDRDVEHYKEDLGAITESGPGTNMVVFAGRPQLLSLPPRSMAIAQRLRDELVC